MPFGPTFWVDGWMDVLHPHLFPNASLTADAVTADWRQWTLESWTTTECIQGPINNDHNGNVDGLNIGHFLGLAVGGAELRITMVDTETGGQFVTVPNLITLPIQQGETEEFKTVGMRTPFFKLSSSGPPDYKLKFWTRGAASSVTYDLYHVQPIAFRGVISEVIAAIIMYAGFDPNMVDKQSFDDAYDTELSVGSDNNERPYVWVIPVQGEKIIDTIKRVVRHWSHLLTFNPAGKLAIMPADSPYVNSVILGNRSNILELSSSFDDSLVLNFTNCMHGGNYIRHAKDPGAVAPWPTYEASLEPHLKSDYTQAFTDEYKDDASIEKYGKREFGDRPRETAVTAEYTPHRNEWAFGPIARYEPHRTLPVTVDGVSSVFAHFPLYHIKAIKDLIMERFISNDTKIRSIVDVKQDFLGLDYDIGSIVVIPNMGDINFRCIKQTIDFNNFTVNSTLVQERGTEHLTASTVIWSFINTADAPVGSTSLEHIATSTRVTVGLTVTPSGHDWFYRLYLSKDGGTWEEWTSGWTAEAGNLIIAPTWEGLNSEVRVIIQGTDDDGVGGQSIATPLVLMPTATI